ncbi:uncharacterized protein LOC133841976 isoform X1 [Drosophila sulfurigaster albostrigata]|uniref:uncharacterized protein LOC133841976 isoform X1 n=1 Tax=Drosophila sulfurigaster albostrigata TaxID=89887 RepID=UPI002D21DEFE|nr:uncharacterized protein LOC133841976 isoform X1 [Drosophila sulfurigaster albostrigata]XP_062130834.1 uncharacterized protein LOC133841976 isoform X1 [Drosophila sulfurigaster albostrigata]XP_062130835.1 uncharacterized protein LOC133841976 isoform X1 [Drosophila sulfurigaster albostrigata]
MRVRDKRKQQKEQKAQKANDKQKQQQQQQTEAEPKAASKAATPTATSTATPTLPATEKVAFDNRIKRKNVLALNEKVAALREYDRQPVYKHVGRMFNCSPDQIKRIVQQKEEILRAWEQRTRRSQDAKTQELKVVRVSMLGKAVYDWIRRMMYYKDFIISDGLIQKMALQFKSFMGLNNFFPHQEWCDKFRATYNIQHNDTKLLKIGYTQSHSVQINDIAKDVMSECTPAAAQQEHEDQDDEEEDGDLSLATISGSSHDDDDGDDERDVDVDGGGDLTDEEEQDVKPTISELQQTRVLQPLPQLMRLPQVPPGTSQKVLLATPILPPGAAAAAGGAQTMTIIPLATLAQSITQRPLTAPTTTTTATPKAGMPPPMLDIKQEIKTEPKDEEEQPQQLQQQQQEEEKPIEEEPEQEPLVRIKQELDSDGELLDGEEDEEGDNGGRSSVNSLVEILAGNADVEQQYIEQTRAMRSLEYATPPMTILPPMPTLTKAPRQSPLPTATATPPPPAKRQRHDDNNNGEQSSSTIISCSEARKYLKRLEEFALSRENYRLIGLITRADEVMRELADE